MKGFVYIMSNPAFSQNDLKIGYTDRDPAVFRANELDSTGVPEPFIVEYFAFVENPRAIEGKVHVVLDEFRIRKSREFFRCSIDTAIQAIREVADFDLKYDEILYDIVDEPEATYNQSHPSARARVNKFQTVNGYFGTKIDRLVIDPEASLHRWDGVCEACGCKFAVTILVSPQQPAVAICPDCFSENVFRNQ